MFYAVVIHAVSSHHLRPPRSTLFPYTTLFRSEVHARLLVLEPDGGEIHGPDGPLVAVAQIEVEQRLGRGEDRKSTRLNSSHLGISYAVFCLKKKKKHERVGY